MPRLCNPIVAPPPKPLSDCRTVSIAFFVAFSSPLLENNSLFGVTDRLHHGFNSGVADKRPSEESKGVGSQQGYLFKDDLVQMVGTC